MNSNIKFGPYPYFDIGFCFNTNGTSILSEGGLEALKREVPGLFAEPEEDTETTESNGEDQTEGNGGDE